jgi:signal transduction histidine kinase
MRYSVINTDSLLKEWDALQQKLQTADAQTIPVILDEMNDLAWRLSRSDPREAIIVCEQARELSALHNEKKQLARSIRNRALCHKRIGDYEFALKDFSEAARLFDEQHDLVGKASTLNGSGQIFMELGDFAGALQCFEQSHKLYERSIYPIGIAAALMSLGAISTNFGELELSLDYLNRSVKIYRIAKDKRGEAAALCSIGSLYIKLGANVEAIRCFDEALKVYEEFSDDFGKAITSRSIGETYEMLGEDSKALVYYEQSLNAMRAIGDKKGEASALLSLGKFYMRDNSGAQSFEKTRRYLTEALEIATAMRAKAQLFDIHEALAKMYEETAFYQKALFHYHEFYRVKTELIGEEAKRRLRNQQIAYAIEKAERESEMYRLQSQKLAESNKVLKEIADLKNYVVQLTTSELDAPLRKILEKSDKILKNLDDVATTEEYSYEIYSAADKMLNAVRFVQQATEIDLGKFEIVRKPVQIALMLGQLIAELRRKAWEKGQKIVFSAEDKLQLDGDEHRLRESFEDIILTIVRHAEPESQLFITALKKEQHISVTIKSDGLSLTTPELDALFQKFRKLPTASTDPSPNQSASFGLYVAKKLIELHGGKIWAEPEPKRKGVAFYAELPLVNP